MKCPVCKNEKFECIADDIYYCTKCGVALCGKIDTESRVACEYLCINSDVCIPDDKVIVSAFSENEAQEKSLAHFKTLTYVTSKEQTDVYKLEDLHRLI